MFKIGDFTVVLVVALQQVAASWGVVHASSNSKYALYHFFEPVLYSTVLSYRYFKQTNDVILTYYSLK